ncbi:hypothetical protein D3C86_1298020 [compost metagenome]
MVVAIAVVGELIDLLHDANGRADIGGCVQAKHAFGEAPVADGLVVLQQRLDQGLGTRHLTLLDAVLRRMPAVAVIQGDQQRGWRVDVFPPFLPDQLRTELLG